MAGVPFEVEFRVQDAPPHEIDVRNLDDDFDDLCTAYVPPVRAREEPIGVRDGTAHGAGAVLIPGFDLTLKNVGSAVCLCTVVSIQLRRPEKGETFLLSPLPAPRPTFLRRPKSSLAAVLSLAEHSV